jgi:branched-chain amino acid transport system substrate-binding protein
MKNRLKILWVISVMIFIVLGMLLIKHALVHEIRIGVVIPMSGPLNEYGRALRAGILLAAMEINQESGILGPKLQIIIQDSKSDPEQGAEVLAILADSFDVSILIGGTVSPIAKNMIPIIEEKDLVLLSPTLSSEEVLTQSTNMFSIHETGKSEGRFVARFVYEILRKKTVTPILILSTPLIEVDDAFREEYLRIGGKIITELEFQYEAGSFKDGLRKLKNKNIESIVLFCHKQHAIQILAEAKAMNITSQFITIGSAYDNISDMLVCDGGDGLMIILPYILFMSDDSLITEFRNVYMNEYKEEPTMYAAYGYDALMIAFSAIRNAEAKRSSIQTELLKTKNYDGVTGKMKFNDNGSVERMFGVMVIRDGELKPYSR